MMAADFTHFSKNFAELEGYSSNTLHCYWWKIPLSGRRVIKGDEKELPELQTSKIVV